MRPLLKIGCVNLWLKDATHLQTVLKALTGAIELDYDPERRLDGKCCYYHNPFQPTIEVEMVEAARVRAAKTPKAIDPEIIEDESDSIDITVPGRRRAKRKALPAPIDFQAEFRKMREIAAVDGHQLLLGPGGGA